MNDTPADLGEASEGQGEPAVEGQGRRRALIFIVFTVFLDTMGFGIVIPIMPDLVSALAGVSVAEAAAIGGWLIMSYALAQFVCSPIVGNLSDRFGRRPVLLLSMAGFAISYLISAFAPSLLFLFFARIVAGIFGASYTTAYAYIADVSGPENRAQNFGLVGVAFGLGFIFGPALGGLAGATGYQLPLLMAAGLAGLNLLFGLFVLPESLPLHRRRPFEWRRATTIGSIRQLRRLGRPLVRLATVLFLWMLSLQALQSIWPYYTMARYGWTTLETGLSLTMVGVLAVLVNWLLVKRAVKWIGEWRTALIGSLAGATSFAIYGLAADPRLLFLGILIGGIGGLTYPAMQALMTLRAPASQQGELQGAIALLSSLTVIIGPPMFSQLLAFFGAADATWPLPGMPFFLGSLLAFSAALLLWRTGGLAERPQ